MAKRLLFKPIILSIIIIGLLAGINQQGWLVKTRDCFFNLINPFQESLYDTSLKTRNLASFLSSLKDIKNKNENLEKQNRKLLGEIARLNEVSRENEFLREQLNLSDDRNRQLILSNVIGQDLSGSGRYLLIDKGEKNGIEEKMTVITAGDILVGRVIKVMPSSSKVQLITDINSRVNASLQESGTTGLIHGDLIGLTIDLISQGESIKEGEMAVTSGLAGIFPTGLLIGIIEKIVSTDAQVFQKAEVDSAANFGSLEKVFVIR